MVLDVVFAEADSLDAVLSGDISRSVIISADMSGFWASFDGDEQMTMKFGAEMPIHTEFQDVVIIDSSAEAYTGEYLVIPTTEDQILATNRKRMTDNVTVKQVPYAQVTNPYGGDTITIL